MRLRCALRPFGIALLILAVPLSLTAQTGEEGSGAAPINSSDDPLLQPFRWRSIGPAGQGGRVDDIEVSPSDPRVIFVGFATGGLWRSTNRGVTFEPVFDTYSTHSIGDVAIAPSDPSVVWVGTGEANNRQSSSFGDGIYKSQDGGETFTAMGLRGTETIARVLVHPADPSTVWVAAPGRLFAPSPERGVYKTTDGGLTWRKVLFVDEDTGATDLVMDPSNPDRLFAATYQRRRSSWGFVGGGPGSGLWRSEDGGDSWEPVTGSGLPTGTMGRIALAMAPSDPRIIYAQIEVAADRDRPLTGRERREWQRLAEVDSLPPYPQSSGIWRSQDGGRSWEFRSNHNPRPMYFSQIRVHSSNPDIVYTAGLPIYRSTDGGGSFVELEGFGHVDQHAIWVDPVSGEHLMIGNDGSVDETWDGGKTWESYRNWAVGQPYYASVDMRRPYYVCTGLQDNGSWCGPSSVRAPAILAQDWYRVGGGDGFQSAVDPTDYTIVYSESQNGNIRRVDLGTGDSRGIRPRAPTQQSSATNIVPEPEEGTELRWNWQTPFILSHSNPRIIYLGGNRLFRSLDRGDSWTMSPDLTRRIDRDDLGLMYQRGNLPRCSGEERGVPCILSKNDGVSWFGTAITVAESPLQPDVLWVGTDDGNLQVSRDGGASWTEVGGNLPGGTRGYYVSRVEASWFDPSTAYASLDGHRDGDLAPYIFLTRDYGESWEAISSDLPARGNVNTVRQDPNNRELLYAGTEFGFFISLDEGKSWKRFMNGLPVVRVDDVLVHPRDNDLVLSTHGRSIWIMDDVTSLQQLGGAITSEDAYLFPPREAVLWKTDPRLARSVTGDKNWQGENAPTGTALSYLLAEDASDQVTLTITDLRSGEAFRELEGTSHAGMNRVQWDLRGDPLEPQRQSGGGPPQPGPLAPPGVYRVTLNVAGQTLSQTVTVLDDNWMDPR